MITRLAQLRKRRGMTQKELSLYACFAPLYISFLESGLRDRLQMLAHALNYDGDPMELLELVEEDD